MLNNENTWTQGGEHHTLGSVGGNRGGTAGGGELGRINKGILVTGDEVSVGQDEEGLESYCIAW